MGLGIASNHDSPAKVIPVLFQAEGELEPGWAFPCPAAVFGRATQKAACLAGRRCGGASFSSWAAEEMSAGVFYLGHPAYSTLPRSRWTAEKPFQ